MEEKKFEINVKSDYFNPLTNQGANKNSKKRDDTLELLAIPVFNNIKIERIHDIELALSIYNKMVEITNLADD